MDPSASTGHLATTPNPLSATLNGHNGSTIGVQNSSNGGTKEAAGSVGAHGEASNSDTSRKYSKGQNPMLRYQKPYWWPYKTFCKQRWIGRELLEVVSTEFRDRSIEYYRHALENGVTRVNGATAGPGYILRNGDRIDNTVHRHEPPITNDPVAVLHLDKEREFVVISKPGSIPVHPTGRYFRHSVLELLKSDYDITAYSVNRLDRLTSGLMILSLTTKASKGLSEEFMSRTVRKEYVARVKGNFPDGVVQVDKPMMTVDRQMGLVIITPEGKEAKTLFRKMSYDAQRDESVVHCRPLTGRTHQIRVHLQFLGHPISNDPLYCQSSVWGPDGGKGGIDLVPNDPELRNAALAARIIANTSGATSSSTSTPASPASVTLETSLNGQNSQAGPSKLANAKTDGFEGMREPDWDDRTYGNIDITSPIPLSDQAREIIAKLRKMKDEQEDWVKWKEVVFRAKEAQGVVDPASLNNASVDTPDTADNAANSDSAAVDDQSTAGPSSARNKNGKLKSFAQTSAGKSTYRPVPYETPSPLQRPDFVPEGFCEECYIPLPDDPDPEKLFIYLHALRYTTDSLGSWATKLPRWAEEDWGGDWRGWSDQEVPEPFELPPGIPKAETGEDLPTMQAS